MIQKIFTLFILLLCVSFAYADDSAVLKAVESSARAWLDLNDKAEYAESWRTASVHFKQKRQESDWLKTADNIRKPLGDMGNRYIAAAGYSKPPSGFPEGEYIILQFYATFKNQALALETVTLIKEQDSVWRVVDYALK